MSIYTSFHIILGLLAAIVIIAIFFYVRLKKTLDAYYEGSLKVQNAYLETFGDTLKQAIASYQKELNRSVARIQRELEVLESTQQVFLKDQVNRFQQFTSDVKVEFKDYIARIEKLNFIFGELNERLKIGIDDYEKIAPVLEENYNKLELVSDKSKEIISDHQKAMLDHNERLQHVLDGLSVEMQATTVKLKAENEKAITEEISKANKIITEMVNHANSIFKEISDNTKNKLEEVAQFSEERVKEVLDKSIILNLGKRVSEVDLKVSEIRKESTGRFEALQDQIKELGKGLEERIGKSKGSGFFRR